MKKSKTVAKAALRTTAAPRPQAAGAGADLDLIRNLAQVVTEFDLSELEVDPSGRIRISRGKTVSAIGAAVHGAPLPAPSAAPASAPAAAPAEDGVFIMSPFVGTFYRSPSPDAAPFVDAGNTIRKGQVICIIEAMKLMNEIESELDGKILDVLAKNGDHVEYGQKLFRVGKA